MHATLTFSDVLPLPHGHVPGVSLLISLCITSTSEASPDIVARPTTQPAWPLSSQQQTLFLSVSQHILYCVSVFSSLFFFNFLFKRRAPCRVLLILQANALTINSISIEQRREHCGNEGSYTSALGKLWPTLLLQTTITVLCVLERQYYVVSLITLNKSNLSDQMTELCSFSRII